MDLWSRMFTTRLYHSADAASLKVWFDHNKIRDTLKRVRKPHSKLRMGEPLSMQLPMAASLFPSLSRVCDGRTGWGPVSGQVFDTTNIHFFQEMKISIDGIYNLVSSASTQSLKQPWEQTSPLETPASLGCPSDKESVVLLSLSHKLAQPILIVIF